MMLVRTMKKDMTRIHKSVHDRSADNWGGRREGAGHKPVPPDKKKEGLTLCLQHKYVSLYRKMRAEGIDVINLFIEDAIKKAAALYEIE